MADLTTVAPTRARSRSLDELERASLESELRHWRSAVTDLADLDTAATPQAWAGLESYLGRSIRASLVGSTTRLAGEADRVAARLAGATTRQDLRAVRTDVLRLRRRYLQVESVISFFGDAVRTRANPRIAAILRGLDALAVDSMERVLRPLGIDVPPVLTYLHVGLGASIVRSRSRLWDDSLSPAAAIKVTHHHMKRPSSVMHESGHQVAFLTGWNAELATALHDTLEPTSPFAAQAFRSWASEVAADVHAFVHLGYAPVPALATVVDGTTPAVLRMVLGDPHPFGWIRVQFNVALCRSWFGPGPWDDLAEVWAARHPLSHGSPEAAEIAAATMPRLADLVDVCTRAPMQAFHGRSLSDVVDPRRVSPGELRDLAQRAGDSLYTSTYLQRTEAMRILAWTVLQEDEVGAARPPGEIEAWLRRVGGEYAPAA